MRTIKRDIVGAFIISRDNKILMGKSHKGGVYPGCWIVPGGGMEPGETKLQALIREILEETGLDISSAKIEEIEGALSGQTEKIMRESGERVLADMRFYNFTVRLDGPANESALRTDDDFVDAKWFPLSELPNLKLSPPSTVTFKKLGYL